jgi:hypothetical protein
MGGRPISAPLKLDSRYRITGLDEAAEDR